MKVLTTFAGQNWLITPAALAVGQQPPKSIHDQKFLLVLTGVAIADFQGNSSTQWLRDTLSFLPDMAGPQNSGPLNWAIGQFNIPKPTTSNYKIAFSLDEWAPFASLSSIFDQNQSVNAGFAVDVWRPTHFGTGKDAFSGQTVGNIFAGIDVDVAVSDNDAIIYRLGYNISLLGKIVFLTMPETLFQSNFDGTPDGQPPSPTQQVGTAQVSGPAGSVIVITPAFVHSNKWLQISRPNGPDLAIFRGIFSAVRGDGIYTFSAAMFMPAGSQTASISFQAATGQEFLHLDFRPENHVRIDDSAATDFGTFPRNQPFVVTATLNINATQSTVQVTLSGVGASGQTNYNVLAPFQSFSRQFGAIQVWQGFPWTGAFDATSIVVTRT